MLDTISLFSGIGAFEKALNKLNIDVNVINYCEIDRNASKSYSVIHNVSEDRNLWDVSKIDFNMFKGVNVDLLTHGSPCTNFSIIGKQEGGNEGSGTASSLLWYSVKLIDITRPKVVVWENVKNVLSDMHKHNAKRYLDTLEGWGYTNHYKVLNACDYGIPQNRERIFIVSILDNSIDFKFPEKVVLTRGLYDYLDITVDNKWYCNIDNLNSKNATNWESIGYGVVCDYRYDSGYRIRKNGLAPTLLCKSGSSSDTGNCLVSTDISKPKALRRLTSKECFRLMGFTDNDYDKCVRAGVSATQLGKQAGNSIVVNVLEAIFRELYLKEEVDTSGF